MYGGGLEKKSERGETDRYMEYVRARRDLWELGGTRARAFYYFIVPVFFFLLLPSSRVRHTARVRRRRRRPPVMYSL